MLYGLREMAQYMRKHPMTVWRWVHREAFPAAKTPDGRLMTTTTLIDNWILSRAQMERTGELGNAAETEAQR